MDDPLSNANQLAHPVHRRFRPYVHCGLSVTLERQPTCTLIYQWTFEYSDLANQFADKLLVDATDTSYPRYHKPLTTGCLVQQVVELGTEAHQQKITGIIPCRIANQRLIIPPELALKDTNLLLMPLRPAAIKHQDPDLPWEPAQPQRSMWDYQDMPIIKATQSKK